MRKTACVRRAKPSAAPSGLTFPVLPKYGCQPVKKEFRASILLRRLDPAGNDDARQLADEIAKGVAAHLEILELVVGGAGRRQQHHRMFEPRRLGVPRRLGYGTVEGAGDGILRLALERHRKVIGGFADQIGLADAGKE